MKKEHEEYKYRPLRGGGMALVVACCAAALGLSMGVGMFRYADLSVTSTPSAVFIVSIGAIAFLLALFIWVPTDESLFSFGKYIRRNVRGYYKIFRWERLQNEKLREETPCYVERRELRTILSMRDIALETEYNRDLIVAIPLGGWFARPKLKCNWLGRDDWKIKPRFSGYNRNPDSPCLWLYLKEFKIAVNTVQEIAELAADSSMTLHEVVRYLLNLRGSLEKSEREFMSAIRALYQVIGKIWATNRFQNSTEGKNIRKWIISELDKLLPAGDVRRLRLISELDKLLPADDVRRLKILQVPK